MSGYTRPRTSLERLYVWVYTLLHLHCRSLFFEYVPVSSLENSVHLPFLRFETFVKDTREFHQRIWIESNRICSLFSFLPRVIKNVARFGKNLFFHDTLSNLELEGEQQNRKIRSKATTFYPLCNKPHSVKQEIETFRDFPKERKRREEKKREKKKNSRNKKRRNERRGLFLVPVYVNYSVGKSRVVGPFRGIGIPIEQY